MSAKHTPGPWHVSSFAPLNIVRESGAIVADCCSCWQANDGEREANARLISAAPDLLAALEDLLSIADQYPANYVHVSTFDRARSAIAKAKGE